MQFSLLPKSHSMTGVSVIFPLALLHILIAIGAAGEASAGSSQTGGEGEWDSKATAESNEGSSQIQGGDDATDAAAKSNEGSSQTRGEGNATDATAKSNEGSSQTRGEGNATDATAKSNEGSSQTRGVDDATDAAAESTTAPGLDRAESAPSVLPPITIRDSIEREPTPAEQSPAFTTQLKISESPRATASLSDHLDANPGLQINRLGGPGSYSTLRIRGASGDQLAVFLDGIPISLPSQGDVNLEELPLDALDRIEVYRGQSPLEFGANAIGGVLNLVSRLPTRSREYRFRLSSGSFGYWHGSTGLGLRKGSWDGQLTGGTRGCVCNFPYYDDNGTPHSSDDDRIETRINNDSQLFEATARSRYRARSGARLLVQLSALSKEQGLAGAISVPTYGTRYGMSWANGALKFASRPGLATFSLLASSTLKKERLWNLSEEADPLMSSSDITSRIHSSGLVATGNFLPGAYHALEAMATFNRDSFETPGVSAEWGRTRGGLGAQYEYRTTNIGLVSGLLAERLVSRATLESGAGDDDEASIETLLTPRAGIEWTPGSQAWVRSKAPSTLSWTMRANAGRYHRIPSFFELFGYAGATNSVIMGNTALRPEQGINLDLGGALEKTSQRADARLELSAFYSKVSDFITYIPNSQQTVRPENLESARMSGLECALGLRRTSLGSFNAGYTFLDARNQSHIPSRSGKQLPGRARHSLLLMATARYHQLKAYYRIQAISGMFLDPSNLQPIPGRILHDLGLTIRGRDRNRGRLELSLELKNLLNSTYANVSYVPTPQPIVDYLGFPLPGRSVYLTLSWKN